MATFNQTEILWDKYKGVPDAYPGSSFIANQAVGTAIPQIIPESQTWSSSIPATAPTDLGSVVTITNGSYRQSASYPWIRKYTVTMGAIQSPGISYWYASTNVNNPVGTNACRDSIPFNYDPLGSYNIQVFANGVAVSPTYTPYPWNYDEAAGVLTFFPVSGSVLPPTPITMTYWRYVGGKGGGSLLTYWTITDPSPGSILYFTPSSGTAANIYMTDSAQFLLAGPGCGYLMYDRTNTNAYWDTYSSGNVLNWAYNGSGTEVIMGSLNNSGNLSVTSATIGGTNQITYNGASTRTVFSGGNGILVNGGISCGTSYPSAGIVGLAVVANSGTTNALEIYPNTGSGTPVFTVNSVNVNTIVPILNKNNYRAIDKVAGVNYWDTYTNGTAYTFQYNGGSTYTISTTGVYSGTATTATNANNINIVSSGTGSVNYSIPMVTAGTGNKIPYVDTTTNGMTYNPGNSYLTLYGLIANQDVETSYLHMPDTTNSAHTWEISASRGADILTFNNQWAPGNFPFQINGLSTNPSIITNNQLAGGNTPSTSIELDTPVVSASTASTGTTGTGSYNNGAIFMSTTTNDYASLATTTYTTLTQSSTVTMPVAADNPNGRQIQVAVPVTGYFQYAFTAGGTITITLTNMTVSMARNGTNFTNFSYIAPTFPIAKTYTVTGGTPAANGTLYTVQSPIVMLYVYFIPTNSFQATDTYTINYAQSATGSFTGGGSVIFNPFQGISTFYFPVNKATINTITPTPSSGFTFPAPGIVVPMAIGKTLTTLGLTINGDYANLNYLNLVYSKTFSSQVTEIEQLCFASGYTNYNIVWNFSSAPSAYTSLYIDFVSKLGVNLGASFSGTTAILGATYSTTAWSTTSAIIAYCPSSTQRYYYCTITSPNQSRKKTITATNNGSASASLVDVPMISTGYNTSAVAYPSLLWGVVGTAVSGTINVYGWN